MRKIKIENWKSDMQKKDKDGNPTGEIEKVDENLLVAMNVLIGNKKPEDMPRGLDKFRTFGKLSKAFDKAQKSNELVLVEAEYKFLKDTIKSDIPATWGMNQNLLKAFESFLNAEEVDANVNNTGANKGSS